MASLAITACNAAEVGASAHNSVEINVDVEFLSNAENFLVALFAADESRLLAYEAFPGALSENHNRLADRNRKFIQGPLSKVRAGGRLVPVLDGRRGHLFTVLFVQEDFVGKSRDSKFLSKSYLEHYFACAFDDSTGRWLLRDGFCYDETDGPYPDDDPDL